MADATSTQIQQNQYGFAPQLEPYAEDMLGQAAALTDLTQNPYMQYMGDRVAQFSPLQQMSYDNAALMQGSGQLQDATATAGLASLGALNTGYTYDPITNQYKAPSKADLNYTANTATGDTAAAAKLSSAPTAKAQTTTYKAGVVDPVTGIRSLQQFQMGDPSQVTTQSFVDPGKAASYMSPYMQNVVDIQQREAQRQADIAGTQQQAAATQAGGFGGSRDSIMRAEAARNLATQKGDIQAQGQQAAYQQAQQQFNAEQGYGLQGQMANQQAGLTQGQQNLGAKLGVQQLDTQTGLQTSLANLNNQQQTALANQALKGQYGLSQGQMSQQANMQTSAQKQQAAMQNAAAKNQAKQFNAGQNLASAQNTAQYGQAAANLNSQQGQFGAGLGLQGLQTALTGASTLGNLGNTQYNQNMGINQMQNQLGAQQQQQVQSDLNNQYQDFLGSQNYPYKQIGFMSDILRGAPTTNAGSTMYNYQAPPSMLSQIGGAGAAAIGAFGLKAKGGMVGRYAKGGLVKSRPQGLVALAIHSMA